VCSGFKGLRGFSDRELEVAARVIEEDIAVAGIVLT
jgi:hypothetical protein